MARLATQITCLGHNMLTLVNVMAVALARGVQPLQQCVHPLWKYNGTDDSTRAVWRDFENHDVLGMALEGLFKGEKADLIKEPMFDSFASYRPVEVGWKRWIETVNSPAPQPEAYTSEDDLGLSEDSHTNLIFKDGIFYQESIDGTEVAILFDRVGLPPPAVNTAGVQCPASRKRAASSMVPNAGARAPTTRGQRSKRLRQVSTQEENGPWRNPGPVIGQANAEETVTQEPPSSIPPPPASNTPAPEASGPPNSGPELAPDQPPAPDAAPVQPAAPKEPQDAPQLASSATHSATHSKVGSMMRH